MSSHKAFHIKRFLVKKPKQSRPTAQWIQMKPGQRSKRRRWRRTKLAGKLHD
ncbi:60S ribosomal protein L39-like [Pteronotus mesoamericanus]|uniref:60S ribosomal protein L39-like n=1 Tax=Pteronotus mesoamericanus TaxID=1884717 RepID=UPI0023ED4F05|nr:60S ribosomal protein L39-like [Pteronotus parnellii mesoamericanus]